MMKKYIINGLRVGTLIFTILLVGSVLLQIVARFLFPSTPPWTEEASRLFFIYAIAFASGLAFLENEYVSLDILFNRLSEKGKTRLTILIQGLTTILFGVVAVYSVPFIQLGLLENSPSMGIKMALPFASMLLLASTIAVFSFLELMNTLRNPTS
ncbi:MAG: TRAP transporter small permease subunit [Bacteroidota bacterium]